MCPRVATHTIKEENADIIVGRRVLLSSCRALRQTQSLKRFLYGMPWRRPRKAQRRHMARFKIWLRSRCGHQCTVSRPSSCCMTRQNDVGVPGRTSWTLPA